MLSKSGGWLIHTVNSFAIGIVGDAGVRGSAQQPRLFVGMILILIFAEVLGNISFSFISLGTTEGGSLIRIICVGLYGLIVALLMNSKAGQGSEC